MKCPNSLNIDLNSSRTCRQETGRHAARALPSLYFYRRLTLVKFLKDASTQRANNCILFSMKLKQTTLPYGGTAPCREAMPTQYFRPDDWTRETVTE
jgi:hypothetical protein